MTSEDSPDVIVAVRVEAIVEFLDGLGIAFELVEHESVMSAAAEARVAHLPPDQVAKTVLLHDGSAYVLAAIPASARLDLNNLRGRSVSTRRWSGSTRSANPVSSSAVTSGRARLEQRVIVDLLDIGDTLVACCVQRRARRQCSPGACQQHRRRADRPAARTRADRHRRLRGNPCST
jgi:hypothetical protein